MKTKNKCPKCNREINLEKSQTSFQKEKNKMAKEFAEKVSGIKLPEIKNYYCDCGLHITFIKSKGEWKWISAS